MTIIYDSPSFVFVIYERDYDRRNNIWPRLGAGRPSNISPLTIAPSLSASFGIYISTVIYVLENPFLPSHQSFIHNRVPLRHMYIALLCTSTRQYQNDVFKANVCVLFIFFRHNILCYSVRKRRPRGLRHHPSTVSPLNIARQEHGTGNDESGRSHYTFCFSSKFSWTSQWLDVYVTL